MIKNLKVKHFKSFCDLSLDLNNFCVFIGPNGSGKSNFIDIFKFIRDVETLPSGTQDAARNRLGWDGIVCKRKRAIHSIDFRLSGSFSKPISVVMQAEGTTETQQTILLENFIYELEIDQDLTIINEFAEIVGYESSKPNNKKIKSSFNRSCDSVIDIIEFYPPLRASGLKELQVRHEKRFFPFLANFQPLGNVFLRNYLTNMNFHNVDVNRALEGSSNFDDYLLSENASNISSILYTLDKITPATQNLGKLKDRIVELMQTSVPGFENWVGEQLKDGKFDYSIKELKLKKLLNPKQISSGTIKLLAIFAALLYHPYPDRPSIILIEEPENYLHPQLMEILVELMREVSKDYQVIVTTHSRDIVRNCTPEEVYLIDKQEGLSTIRRASSINQIEQFLENFTLDELWLQGYLDLGIPIK